MFEDLEDLYYAIERCDLVTVSIIIAENNLDINDPCNEYHPLTMALMLRDELKGSEQANTQQLNNIEAIINVLLLAKDIDYNVYGYEYVSSYEYVIDQDDVATFVKMYNKDPNLFVCNSQNICPYEYAFYSEARNIQQFLEQVMSCSLNKINSYIEQGTMVQAIYCFMHIFEEKAIVSHNSLAVFRTLLYWALAEQIPVLVSKLLNLNIPNYSMAEGNCILNIIATRFADRKILGFFTPKLVIEADSLFVRIFIDPHNANIAGALYNRMLNCKLHEPGNAVSREKITHVNEICDFISLMIHAKQTWPLLALPLANLSSTFQYLVLKKLILKKHTVYTRYLFDNAHIQPEFNVSLNDIEMPWYLFALHRGDVEVANFHMQNFADKSHYQLLRNYYSLPISSDFTYTVMLAWLKHLSFAQNNELIAISQVKHNMNTTNILIAQKHQQLLKWAACLPTPFNLQRLELVEKNSQADKDLAIAAKLQIVHCKIYTTDEDDFATRYEIIIDSLKQWFIENNCGSTDALDLFWRNMIRDATAPRHMLYEYKINYCPEVKQALELIYYHLTENQQISLSKKKICIQSMCEQIDKCGPGSRQSIEDCLISLDSDDINTWLGVVKLEVIKTNILQANLFNNDWSTHFISWAHKYMRSLGYDIPATLFATVDDTLFNIEEQLVEHEIEDLKRNLLASYRNQYNLNLIVKRAEDQFIDIFRNQAGLPEDWRSDPVILKQLQIIGLTYSDITAEVKIFKDIFNLSKEASALSKLRDYIATFSQLDDPQLLDKYDLRFFADGQPEEFIEELWGIEKEYFHIVVAKEKLNIFYYLDEIYGRFTLQLSDCPEIVATSVDCIYAVLKRAIRQDMRPNTEVAKFHIINHLQLKNLLYPVAVTDFSFWQPGTAQTAITTFPTLEFDSCNLQLIMLAHAIYVYADHSKSNADISNAIQYFPIERLNDQEFSDLLNSFNNHDFYTQLRNRNKYNGYLAEPWVKAHLLSYSRDFIPAPYNLVPPPPLLPLRFALHGSLQPLAPPPSPKRLRVQL